MDYKQVVNILSVSSDMVLQLGDIRLSDDSKLSLSLDIDNIQFWDAIAVELALYHLPKVLSKMVGFLRKWRWRRRSNTRCFNYLQNRHSLLLFLASRRS